MAARRVGRFLAPLALLATAGAIALVVKDHLDKASGGGSTTSVLTGAGPLSHSPRLTGTHKKRVKFYRVRAGNTLSGISAKTGVPIATIVQLNPGLDPSALQTGQRLRLRR